MWGVPFPLKAPDDIWLKTDGVENSSVGGENGVYYLR